MKKDNRNLIISIIAVAMIIILAGGGTYAWLTWRSANNTVVNITVAGGTYTLDGGGNITSGKNIAPTDQCNHSTYGIQRTITAKATNETTTNMIAYVQLNPSTFPTAFKNANIKWVLSTSSSNCTTASNIVASGDFSNVVQGTKFTLTSFNVPAATTTVLTKTYYLYIWVAESYAVENVGTTVTNSIQDKSFTLQLTGEMTNNPNA